MEILCNSLKTMFWFFIFRLEKKGRVNLCSIDHKLRQKLNKSQPPVIGSTNISYSASAENNWLMESNTSKSDSDRIPIADNITLLNYSTTKAMLTEVWGRIKLCMKLVGKCVRSLIQVKRFTLIFMTRKVLLINQKK